MTTEAENIAGAALQTAVALAPTLAAADPRVAAVALGIELMQKAMQANEAGLLPTEQLANLFASIGSGVQSTHNAWAAMNAADAAKAGAQ